MSGNPWTPGPWDYVGYQDGEEGIGWFVRVAPHRVVLVEGRSASEADANARLIQHAPKMAEALERSIPALWLLATSGNADAVAMHDQARTLLSRIRGDAP